MLTKLCCGDPVFSLYAIVKGAEKRLEQNAGGCGSENIRKNGTAPAGCKKMHCRNCSFCSASDIETE